MTPLRTFFVEECNSVTVTVTDDDDDGDAGTMRLGQMTFRLSSS